MNCGQLQARGRRQIEIEIDREIERDRDRGSSCIKLTTRGTRLQGAFHENCTPEVHRGHLCGMPKTTSVQRQPKLH